MIFTFAWAKALEIRYALMDCYLVDIHWLEKAFGNDRIWNFEIKPTDGTSIFANLEKGGKFELIDEWNKERKMKNNGGKETWTPIYRVGVQSANHYTTSSDVW